MDIFSELNSRGLVDNVTAGFDEHVKEKRALYIGIDPTSSSLHLGNLQGLFVAKMFLNAGFDVFILVGSFTALIGDPSGKSKERNLLSVEKVNANVKEITAWIRNFMGTDVPIVSNIDWFRGLDLLSFLTDVGKFFRLGSMIAKDSVKSRINSDQGISYTEFSYQVLQAYDFYHLFQNNKVTVQIGGSDQWGNMTAGCDLVRKKLAKDVFALTFPLITKEDGTKFGKTESGAIWLDKNMLSEFMFYQSVLSLPDSMSIPLLKKLTFMSLSEIESIKDLHPSDLQKILAKELTRVVHKDIGVDIALNATKALGFGEEGLDIAQVLKYIDQYPNKVVQFKENINLVDLCQMSQIVESRSKIKQLISSGAIYVNGRKTTDDKYLLTKNELMHEEYLILNIGKKNHCIFRFTF